MTPVHDWQEVRLKFVAGLPRVAADGAEEYVGLEHVESWTGRLRAIGDPTEMSGDGLQARPGDVLFGKLRPYLAKVWQADRPVACSSEFAVLRPKQSVDGRFLSYALLDPRFIEEMDATTYGARMPRVSPEDIGEYGLVIPPLDSQKTIASFLDRETVRIDTLVEKKRRLLDLLDEKRTALITRAVTRGLDPDVPMKDSGVEWIGEIPEHWEVVQLRYLAQRFFDYRGLTPRKLGMEWGGEIPAISAVNVRDGYVDFTRGANFGSTELFQRWMRDGDLKLDDVLITTEAPLGNVALLPDDQPYILSQRVVAIRPRPQLVSASYLFFQLRCDLVQQRLRTDATGSTAEGISRSKLAAVPLLVPPISEQRTIAKTLAEVSENVSRLTIAVKRAVVLLKEYRAAVVSSAVTGKIDVHTRIGS